MKPEILGIVGTGMIGCSFAVLFAGNGYRVRVLATKPSSAERGLKNCRGHYATLAANGLITEAQSEKFLSRISYTQDYADLNECAVIFECAPENMEVKAGIYRLIAEKCPDVQAVASATSAFDPNELIAPVPELASKFVVAHPWSPPHLVPFTELVPGKAADPACAELVKRIMEGCGRKIAVMSRSIPGFIGNRLQHALIREALYLIEEGIATPRDIDTALQFSFMPRYTSVGLFEHQDAAGMDTVQSIQRYIYPTLCNRPTSFKMVDDLMAGGHVGQRSGSGIYEWTPESIADFNRRAAAPYLRMFNWDLSDED